MYTVVTEILQRTTGGPAKTGLIEPLRFASLQITRFLLLAKENCQTSSPYSFGIDTLSSFYTRPLKVVLTKPRFFATFSTF